MARKIRYIVFYKNDEWLDFKINQMHEEPIRTRISKEERRYEFVHFDVFAFKVDKEIPQSRRGYKCDCLYVEEGVSDPHYMRYGMLTPSTFGLNNIVAQ